MISAHDKEIQDLVADVRDGNLLLPELQRSYVWKAPQVRDLFDSLYHEYPSGQLLVWETDDLPYSHPVSVEGVSKNARQPQLLLDGQQRLTSLTAIMLGRPLKVRGSSRPIDISFNVYTEKCEVSGPRQKGEAGWVSLTRLFTEGAMELYVQLLGDLQLNPADADARRIHQCLTRLENIKRYKYRVNLLSKLDYEEVTHIFVRINSGGTTLGSADLALAQISSRWRGISTAFDTYQSQVWKQKSLWLDSGLFLRTISVLMNGQSRLSQFFRGERKQVGIEDLQSIWARATVALDQALEFLVHNCKIDKLGLLPTKNILIPLAAFFDRFGTRVSAKQSRELQRWVYMALIWSRYSATVETYLDQDVAALNKDEPIAQMIQNIEDKVGRRPVTERELRDQRKNSPYMLMSYVLARYASAEDWFNGVAIGGNQNLEIHHIFPKAILREHYDLKADSYTVDQVANLAFLSKQANTRISSRPPSEYLLQIESARLRAQSVPIDPAHWANFEDFVLARRTLLADGINKLLQSLT
ncbi:MAG TPA: DUF262 domain-containing protein, partial [Herpetosiphonaceae bacterium]|nr:DUF262 domain-containing protein [Herpetosiphonaceae bacterium]